MPGQFRLFFTLVFILILSSCTRPVGVRELPQGPPSRASKVVLDDKLSASDVKELLEALNEHGDLEAVAPYWREPSEAELDAWGGWLSKFVFNPAGDPRGFVSAVGRWTDERRLTALENDLRDWHASATFFDEREFLFQIFLSDKFNPLFERDYRLLNPAIWSAWSASWDSSNPRIRKVKFQSGPLVDELERVTQPPLRSHFETVLAEAAKKHAVPSLFDTAKYYYNHYKFPRFVAFSVLEMGLNRMLREAPEVPKTLPPTPPIKSPYSNQLEQLVAFTASANQPSHNLFLELEKKLKREKGESDPISVELEKWAIESLSELDTPNSLESAHRTLALLPPSMFRSVKELLLEKYKLGLLSPLDRTQFLEAFPGEENKKLRILLRSWFDSVQSVAALDREDFLGGPNLFMAYRDLLRRTASEDVGWLSSFYAWAHSGKFFVRDMQDGKVASPFWHSLIRDGHGVQILRTVSVLPEQPRIAFRDALQEALRGSDAEPRAGVSLHLELLLEALKQRTGFAATLARFFESKDKNPLLLDNEDWYFIERFVLEAGQRFPRDFFAKHSDRHKARKAIQALLRLSRRGELARPIALLAHVNSPSIQRIAGVLKKADATGELAAALRSLELFFSEPGEAREESGLEKKAASAYFVPDSSPGGNP